MEILTEAQRGRRSHNGIMLISICRQRHGLENADMSLERQENCRSSWTFQERDMLTSILSSSAGRRRPAERSPRLRRSSAACGGRTRAWSGRPAGDTTAIGPPLSRGLCG